LTSLFICIPPERVVTIKGLEKNDLGFTVDDNKTAMLSSKNDPTIGKRKYGFEVDICLKLFLPFNSYKFSILNIFFMGLVVIRNCHV